MQLQQLEGNSHQVLKLAGRKIQGLVSSRRKPTVQPATEAENGPQVQMIPRMSYSLFSFGSKYALGLTIPSAPNVLKMKQDMIYELI